MDDPADSSWNWPFWKFGLKKDDLFGTLHDQYNTVPSPILDPEAFHHDVYEISQQATSVGEFHRLLSDRKQQRLRELNETLESAAFEIIANPSLIGTEQWQHAVQLFRTKSLDSLVRYYASYLPSDHPWYKPSDSGSVSETDSNAPSLTDSHGSFFEDEEVPIMDEPFEYPSYPKQVLAASPRSMTMCSDSSIASPIDDSHHAFDFGHSAPSRALSFSESEPDCCAAPGRCDCEHREPKAATISKTIANGVEKDDDSTPQTESPKRITSLTTSDIADSETPTPKPEAHPASFFLDMKPPLAHRRHRSLSPSRPHHPLSERDLDQVLTAHRDPRHPQRARLSRRERECSPATVHRRRRGSPVLEPTKRIHKPLPETARSRPRGRKWAAES
ncbi:hypothetical protein N657DRAFT_640357 [Parathielavia appendiculata]|uniref:Uncharacterized protein n=1 Tax=Parathielavia appendiculata TaxID=2587402 RepID=A0AAN6UBM7_9PEZI|nr:hypothetical protein N657DRAFT_640357 [Parathielavia appendiculata]